MIAISLLRAVNVGGYNKIKMDVLRGLYEELGHTGTQTYVQSGNVVCKAKDKNPAAFARRIEDAIERATGFRTDVIVRTPDELRDVIARNPFADRRDIHPSKLLVTFLASHPAEEACKKIRAIKANPEEMVLDGRELYIYFPDGMARPKLNIASIGKALAVPGTGRNWNTVTKLLEMAEKLEKVR